LPGTNVIAYLAPFEEKKFITLPSDQPVTHSRRILNSEELNIKEAGCMENYTAREPSNGQVGTE
jgi:hypothetical protein